MRMAPDANYVPCLEEHKLIFGDIPMAAKQASAPKARKGVFKAYTPFTPDELEKIDKWGFARRMRNRADVVRALVMTNPSLLNATKKEDVEARR
jgi:hypothetical protein